MALHGSAASAVSAAQLLFHKSFFLDVFFSWPLTFFLSMTSSSSSQVSPCVQPETPPLLENGHSFPSLKKSMRKLFNLNRKVFNKTFLFIRSDHR